MSSAAGVAASAVRALLCAGVTTPAATHAASIAKLLCPIRDELKSSPFDGHFNKSRRARAPLRTGDVGFLDASSITARSPVDEHHAANAGTGTAPCTVRFADRLSASAPSSRLFASETSAVVIARPASASNAVC